MENDGESKLEAGGTFKINLTAESYDGSELKYEDIASYKFFGIDAR